MNRLTVILIISPAPECWGNFKKLCEAKGWKYQTLSNQGKIPKLNKPIEINGFTIHRVRFN